MRHAKTLNVILDQWDLELSQHLLSQNVVVGSPIQEGYRGGTVLATETAKTFATAVRYNLQNKETRIHTRKGMQNPSLMEIGLPQGCPIPITNFCVKKPDDFLNELWIAAFVPCGF